MDAQTDSDSTKERLSLKDAAEEYIQYLESVRCLSENTVTAYRNDLHHLLLCVGEEKLVSDVSESDLISSIGSLTHCRCRAATRTGCSTCNRCGG